MVRKVLFFSIYLYLMINRFNAFYYLSFEHPISEFYYENQFKFELPFRRVAQQMERETVLHSEQLSIQRVQKQQHLNNRTSLRNLL